MAANYYNNSGSNAQRKKGSGNGLRIFLVVVLAILVVSPIDFIPGDAATVVGLLDDVAYVAGIIGTIISMFKKKNVTDSQANQTPTYNDVDSNEK